MAGRKQAAQEVCARLHAYDGALRAEYPLVCGVDEAGRGPLCGPVAAAAVILDPEKPIDGLNDSKKLSEQKREALYVSITQNALGWAVSLVTPEDIDRLNILHATMLGMKTAVESLQITPSIILVDGNRCPEVLCRTRAVVKGDATSACIAAASVIAKVTRDRYMMKLDAEFPQYKLAQHKGYPTKEHYALLAIYGIQPFYRRSFLKNWSPQ